MMKVPGVGPACVVLCFAGTPVEVGITMYVLSISSLSEVKMVLRRLYCSASTIFN